ncbi:MAG: sigma-70 family RNA polymerase sigma factor [candidate division Zixibacteria bacterium]|nr:sigma-70 family RNA polymerase sigma factor [candidate division Zixibacteria bacterium]
MSLEKKKLKIIINGFLKGDSVQFRIIKNKITQYIYHQNFGSDVDRDELISETLQYLYENLKNRKFQGDSLTALNVYIYSIIKFRINRVIRRRKRLSYTDESFDYREDARANPSEEVGNQEIIVKIFDRIDPGCQNLLHMKFRECWSDQEIADHLKKTKNAVSTAISRCVKKVQELDFIRDLM